VAFVIQNQRYLLNEAVCQSYFTTKCLYKLVYGLSIGDKSAVT